MFGTFGSEGLLSTRHYCKSGWHGSLEDDVFLLNDDAADDGVGDWIYRYYSMMQLWLCFQKYQVRLDLSDSAGMHDSPTLSNHSLVEQYDI